ncbi:unnamed protein product, partial [marine sediment metagenome]
KITDGTILLADLGQNSCSNGQMMKWNNATSAWACSDDNNTPLSEAQTEAFIFDGDNVGTLSSGTLALDSLVYTGDLDDVNVNNALTISALGTVDSTALTDGGTIGFDWADAEIVNALTVSAAGTVDSTALTDGGTIGFDWADDEIVNSLTVSSLGTVDKGAISGGTLSFDWSNDEVVDTLTLSGGVIGSNSISGTLTTTGALVIGDGGDTIDLNSTNWDLTAAGALDLAGTLELGSNNVQLTDATGKIQALSSTYLANLSGANLTGVDA